jgi:hypothetical protein
MNCNGKAAPSSPSPPQSGGEGRGEVARMTCKELETFLKRGYHALIGLASDFLFNLTAAA